VNKNEVTLILNDIPCLLLRVSERCDHPDDNWNLVSVEELGNIGSSPVVGSAVFTGESEVGMEVFPNFVTIEVLNRISHFDDLVFYSASEC